MIKTFCDMCGDEIPLSLIMTNSTHFPSRRVHININNDISKDFLVELIVTANIYEPEDLLDKVKSDRLRGHNICRKCIVETLTQQRT